MFLDWGSIRHQACAAAVCSLLVGAPDAFAERVELVNGDVLTGAVVGRTDTHLTLKHAVLGEVKLDLERVKRVIPDEPAGEGEPADAGADAPEKTEQEEKAEKAEKAEKTEQPEPAEPQPDPAAVQARAEQAAAESESDQSWLLPGWDKRLTLGFNGASGNTDRQDYRFAFRTNHTDGRDRYLFDAKWLFAYANGDRTQNQFNSNLTRDWLQKDSNWFFFLKGKYQYDANRSWEHRTSGFGGGGYTVAKTDKVEVNTRLGFGGTYEYGSVNEFTPEALFGGSVLKWDLTERAALSGETIYYPSLEDESSFRIDSRIEWSYKLDLKEGLSLKLGLENEYDSRTPNESGNNDTRYYGALVFDF